MITGHVQHSARSPSAARGSQSWGPPGGTSKGETREVSGRLSGDVMVLQWDAKRCLWWWLYGWCSSLWFLRDVVGMYQTRVGRFMTMVQSNMRFSLENLLSLDWLEGNLNQKKNVDFSTNYEKLGIQWFCPLNRSSDTVTCSFLGIAKLLCIIQTQRTWKWKMIDGDGLICSRWNRMKSLRFVWRVGWIMAEVAAEANNCSLKKLQKATHPETTGNHANMQTIMWWCSQCLPILNWWNTLWWFI